jgi:hypothetical protein
MSRTPDVTYDTIDQTICVPWWARTSRLVTCLVTVNVWCPCLFCLLVVPTSMLFRPLTRVPARADPLAARGLVQCPRRITQATADDQQPGPGCRW